MIDFTPLRETFLIFAFGLPRMLAAFTILPFLSRSVLTGLTRNGVAASLAIFIFPITAAHPPPPDFGMVVGLGVVIKEIFIGMLIGYSLALLFWIMESVGFFIDNQRGATMASSMNPLTGTQTSPLGILLVQALTVIFFVGGGFLLFLGSLYESYQVWPVFHYLPKLTPDLPIYFLKQLDLLMTLTVVLAGPLIIAMFLSEWGLALISRFAPQLNVFFLAMPVKSAVAVLLLVLYVQFLLRYMDERFMEFGQHFRELIELLR